MSLCESSQEVKTIIKELNMYTTTTKLDHNTRIIRMKELATKLKWNELSNLVYQVSNQMVLLYMKYYYIWYYYIYEGTILKLMEESIVAYVKLLVCIIQKYGTM